MKTILIPTIVEDIHAAAVEIVLEKMGHRPLRWFTSNFPQRSTCSFFTSQLAPESLQLKDYFGEISIDEVDVFWNRRIGPPVFETDLIESDVAVATEETNRCIRGILTTISDHCFSVNSYNAARFAENKILQLRIARQIGLLIPETLISNDPIEIKAFLVKHNEYGAIFKPFKPAMWKREERLAIAFTSKITIDQLPENELLQLVPSIFQAYVEKAFEVRVTCMGHEIVAVQLDSQPTHNGKLDWRGVSPNDLNIRTIDLPPDIRMKCLVLLQKLGLVFGCLDFIVTHKGEYIFLEINQMGQFLWIEQANANIPLLQIFCEFLVSADPAFKSSSLKHAFSFWEIAPLAMNNITRDLATHLRQKEASYVYRE